MIIVRRYTPETSQWDITQRVERLVELSLSDAAKMTGKAKSTVHRAIKDGRLSARRAEDGTYHIQPVELVRVFPVIVPQNVQRKDTQHTQDRPDEGSILWELKVSTLEAALEREREALARERETVDDLRRRLDRAEERAQALTHQASPPPLPTPARGFLARLLGR